MSTSPTKQFLSHNIQMSNPHPIKQILICNIQMRYLNNPNQCISYANACSSFLMGKLHYHLWDEVCNATDLKHYF